MESKLSRKERERIVRRDAILEAASVEFAEHGYGRAKLEDIAKRAEFGKGTLYNYFKGGKRGMLFAIFDKLYDDMIALIESYLSPALIEKSSFRQAFYDYTLSSITFYLQRRELFMILVKEAHRMCFGEDEDNAVYFRQQQERVVSALSRPIERAIEAGELRKLDPHAIAHMILGNIQGIQVHLILATDGKTGCNQHEPNECDVNQNAFTEEDAARFLTTMLFDGLTNRS